VIEQFLKSYPNDEGGLVTSVKVMMLAKAGKEREAEARSSTPSKSAAVTLTFITPHTVLRLHTRS
jgi:hypothetical protein